MMQHSGQRSPRNFDTTGPRMDPHSAESISDKVNALKYAFMCLFWYDLLGRIHATNLSVQTIDLSLSCVVDLYRSLKSYISEL